MSITQKPFGIDQIGRPMTLYTMTNKIGASVSVLDFGAHLTSVRVPDRAGKMADVCLGYDTLEEYDHNPCYVGGILGRFANRIAGAAFTLNGKEYTLFRNDGLNSLHGGREGFEKKWWQAKPLEAPGEDALILTYVAHDGEEGYPGKLKVQVTYAFDDECRLTIRYLAQGDQDTVVNLTNHAYYNLAGAGSGTICDHILQVHADAILDAADDLIPNGEYLPVEGTLFDLRAGRRVGDGIERQAEHRLLKAVNGYDVCYVLPGEGMREAAVLREPQSGRVMRVFTDQPGMQVYSGQGLCVKGKGGTEYGPFCGIAMETQHFPDSPNKPQFPTTTLKAGDTYQSTTIYEFSAK